MISMFFMVNTTNKSEFQMLPNTFFECFPQHILKEIDLGILAINNQLNQWLMSQTMLIILYNERSVNSCNHNYRLCVILISCISVFYHKISLNIGFYCHIMIPQPQQNFTGILHSIVFGELTFTWQSIMCVFVCQNAKHIAW